MGDIRRFPTKPAFELALRELGRDRFGIITLDQFRSRGISYDTVRHAVRRGRLIRLHRGVFFAGGDGLPTFHGRVLALCLRGGRQTLAAGLTAGMLWELDGLASRTIELISTRNFRPNSPGVEVRRVERLPPCDVSQTRGVPVTSVARTLIDAGGCVSEETLECALEDALRRRLVSIPRLDWRLRGVGAKGIDGARALSRLLRHRDPDTTSAASALEVRVGRFLRSLPIPRPDAQHVVSDRGRFVARVDFAYPGARLAVEAHSFRWHSGRGQWEKDVSRDYELRRLGWTVVYVTDRMLRDQKTSLSETIVGFVNAQPSLFGR